MLIGAVAPSPVLAANDLTDYSLAYQDPISKERLYFSIEKRIGSDGHVVFPLAECPSNVQCIPAPLNLFLPEGWKNRETWSTNGQIFSRAPKSILYTLGKELPGYAIRMATPEHDFWYFVADVEGLVAFSSKSRSNYSTYFWLIGQCGFGAEATCVK